MGLISNELEKKSFIAKGKTIGIKQTLKGYRLIPLIPVKEMCFKRGDGCLAVYTPNIDKEIYLSSFELPLIKITNGRLSSFNIWGKKKFGDKRLITISCWNHGLCRNLTMIRFSEEQIEDLNAVIKYFEDRNYG